jgi:hypothetical protein
MIETFKVVKEKLSISKESAYQLKEKYTLYYFFQIVAGILRKKNTNKIFEEKAVTSKEI